MRYHIEDIEDQLVSTLLHQPGLSVGVTVRTHVGEVVRQLFTEPAYMQGLVKRLPFVFVEYAGRTTMGYDSDSTYTQGIHTLRFRFFVGAQTLRSTKEGSRNAYSMLRSIYDAVHGKLPFHTGTTPGTDDLSGILITVSEFNPLSPFMPAGAQDEVLLWNGGVPAICVYATEYSIRLLA